MEGQLVAVLVERQAEVCAGPHGGQQRRLVGVHLEPGQSLLAQPSLRGGDPGVRYHFTYTQRQSLLVDGELIEYICNENHEANLPQMKPKP